MIAKWMRLSPNATIPAYMSPGAAGLDLSACLPQSVTIEAGQWQAIATGLALELPLGFEGQVRPRSGLAKKHGITVLNAPGTIDSDYRGEIAVLLVNFSKTAFVVEHGMRIAQLVIAPVVVAGLEVVETLADSDRGQGGFGSTGS